METRSPDHTPKDDQCLPFQVDDLDVRGRIVRLGPVMTDILHRHDYPAVVNRLLAEAVVLTVLLGSALKHEGRFTLQTRSDGAVSMLVVDMRMPGQIRACAQYDEEKLALVGASPAHLLGSGHMAMTIEQGTPPTRYQGVVALEAGSLERAAHHYFAQSEQIPTRIRLAVAEEFDRSEEGPRQSWRAGGIMIQYLPQGGAAVRDLSPGDMPEGYETPQPQEEEAWIEARSFVETVEDVELIDPQVSSERLLYRLFHERGVRIFDPQALEARCSCARDKLGEVIGRFSQEERDAMVENGVITAKCEFCSTTYIYQPDEFEGE